MDIIKVGRKEIDEMKEEIGKKKMEIDETKKEIKDIKSKIAKVRTKIKEVESIFRIVEDAKSLKEHPLALCGCLSRMTSPKERDERIEKELADLKVELTKHKHCRDTLEQRCITLEAQQNELQRHHTMLSPFFGSGSDKERILGSNTYNDGTTNLVKLLAGELQSYIFASTTGMTYNPTTPRDYCHKEVQLSFAFQ